MHTIETAIQQALQKIEEQEVRAQIHELIARKQASSELGRGDPNLLLNTFIEEQLEKWYKQTLGTQKQPNMTDALEEVLTSILVEESQ